MGYLVNNSNIRIYVFPSNGNNFHPPKEYFTPQP
jgi:hypothetical protein